MQIINELPYLKQVADTLSDLAKKDPEAYGNGTYVFTVSFECDPVAEVFNPRVHVQWPLFRDCRADVCNQSSLRKSYGSDSVHLTMNYQGVELATCVFRYCIIRELEALDEPVTCADEASMQDLFEAWQRRTGWR